METIDAKALVVGAKNRYRENEQTREALDMNCIPSRGQRKNIKYSRPVVCKATGLFLCSEVEIIFL